MVRVFDTAEFAPHERRDAYMNAFVSSEVPMQVSFAQGVQLAANMDLWDLGPGIHLLRTRDTGIRLTRSSRHLRIAAPERIAITLCGRKAGIVVGAASQQLGPGDVHVNDQTLPSDYAGYGVGSSQGIIIDYDVLGLPVDLGRRAIQSVAASPLYELFRRHLDRVPETVDALPGNEEARLLVGSATMDLARALLTTAAGGERLVRTVLHETQATRIRAYVDQHLKDRDLSPSSIARANHVSLRQLYNVWESNGTSLSEYIVATRLARAREDLARPSLGWLSIFGIARNWGFADPAHFSRRFKSAYGQTPREWRRHNEQA
jgi:AraC-like DNA-binding protein